MGSLEDIRVHRPETGGLLGRIADCHSEKLDGQWIHLIRVGVCHFTDARIGAITGNEETPSVGSAIFKVRCDVLLRRCDIHHCFRPLLPLAFEKSTGLKDRP